MFSRFGIGLQNTNLDRHGRSIASMASRGKDRIFLLPALRTVGHVIIFCRCGFFFFFSFFSPILSGRRLDVYHTSTSWCGLSANLECSSENVLHTTHWNTGRKNSPSAHNRTLLSGYIFAIKARIESIIGKNLLNSNTSSIMFSQYGELRPTDGWDRLASLVHPSKFQRVWHLGFITAPTSLNGCQRNFARYLAVSWTGTLYIHFRELLPPPLTEFCQVQNSLCLLLYWQRYCTALEQCASAKLCRVVQGMKCSYL